MTSPRHVRAAAEVGSWDNLRFNVLQTIPQLLRGMFTRRPRWSSLLARRQADPQGIHLITELRKKHASDYLWLKVAGKPTLLVLDPEGIRHVLDSSPDVYGPPDLKVRGMSHFQPGAVTISTGDEWKRRRAFNDEVLAVGDRVHPSASEFLTVVDRVLAPLVSAEQCTVTWPNFHGAFRRLTAGVVFGPDHAAESVLSRLDTLLKRANRIVGKTETQDLRAFQDEVRAQLCAPGASGLATAACPHVESHDRLPVAGQVPHWLFAMKDTLSTNCAYALCLIAAHPDVQDRVRSEVLTADLGDPSAVDRLVYLEGCLRDAMRLWPTTPLIVRKVLQDDDLRGCRVPAGTLVMIHNGFNHRNPEAITDPDGYHPEAWQQGVWDYRFNPLSNGPQACAGRELVLFLGKAVLGRLLRAYRWTLEEPGLDPRRPIPQAFDHSVLILTGTGVPEVQSSSSG